MQYAPARQLILDLLRDQKKVKNRTLIEAIGEDLPLFREIRDDLIFEGLAEDFKEVGLVYAAQPTTVPTQAATTAPYDIFFSYAHKDNQAGKIDEIVSQIKAKHRAFSRDHLRIFFDREGIQTMDDWEHNILRALKTCKVMVAVLTPHYFASPYCRREWERFLELEMDYALDGQAIAPLYVLTFPEFEKNPEDILEHGPKDLKRRQYEDLRPWWEEGMQALQAEVIEERFALLEQQCYDRIQKASRHISSHTTIPPHNPKFVGRREELRHLREQLAMRHTGTLVVLQGLAGMGKSALAFEYAHLFGDEYPGGRYLVQAANQQDLKTAIIGLAEAKGVPLTDEERKNPEQAYRKVRAAFEQGEASLILFDNVDDAALLAPSQVAYLLPAADHVHVMATTRLPAGQFSGVEVIAVQELPEENALRLLEQHRPFDEATKAAAQEIVQLLQGYTLAVEVVGVFLWKNPEISYPQYLEQLQQMDIQTLDISGSQDEVQLSRHQEKVISQLLAPTLAQLSETEQQVIQYAALLPPDQVALPWLKDLAAGGKENSWQAEGILDPWQRLVRRLKGLGIFTQTQEANIVRMHRVLQAVIRNHWNLEAQQQPLSAYVKQQASRMVKQWYDREQQWNVAPLMSYCEDKLLKKSAEGVDLANYIFQLPQQLGRYGEAYQLMQKAIQVAETMYQPPHPCLGAICSYTATIELDLGNYVAAKKWTLKAIKENIEKICQAPHPSLGTTYSNLAIIEKYLGNYAAARDWMLKAITENDEKVYQPPHPILDRSYSNLALIEQALGNYAEAKKWMLKAIHENMEKIYQAPHPTLGRHYSNLAMIEKDLRNYKAAKQWMIKAITENDEQVYQPPHPQLGISYSNLAIIEQALGSHIAARDWMLKAIEEKMRKYTSLPTLT